MDLKALASQAGQENDFTKESKGGDFKKELPEEGKALARLREYIELGEQDTATKKYPNKKPARKASFIFELVTPKHIQVFKEGEQDEFRRPHTIKITVPISNSSKSNFIKLFRCLNYKQDVTHPAQLLGRGFLCDIIHASKDGNPITKANPAEYANLQKDGMYTFAAPRTEDPLAGTVTELQVPPLFNGDASLKLFLFDNPTQETWDSLFIEGTYERDGKEMSKNFIQETIIKAYDYPGSALEQMLLANEIGGEGLDDLPTEAQENVSEAHPDNDPLAGIV